ncbi:MAG: hypothetical protein C4323_19780 [Mastigocladus sp. ERB_26_2]|mgnify:CR=1 FL=1|uniref:Uncharacterized protein n=1 Tax=Fischerella muscicola CCMEE 5323 TaxID=2019572 RepID=A0A2N6JXS2_FISMU|nr:MULTISPECIES: hypothetical protein [Fischerella]MBD2433763.1 hypothetical protein [Fischerella sp. FACHB-380]PLZ85361.1 hypothetical protein CEN44_22450 [Fischerella muscicola CCMEE 5323]
MTQPIFCQTPTRGFVNLAYARKVCFREIHYNMAWQLACVIIWSNGEKESFFGKDAKVIVQTLEKMK